MGASAGAEDGVGLSDFIAKYHCKIVEQFELIHERGTRANAKDRFVVLASQDNPQKFAQCILFDFDTNALCEVSSGRYGPALADVQSLYLGPESLGVLKELGFSEPEGQANHSKELRMGLKPNFFELATLMLTVMYRVMGMRDGNVMLLTAPVAAKSRTLVTPCTPLS